MNRMWNLADENRPFPVLEEKSLPHIARKFMRGARRDLSELPAVLPGSVLVFRHGPRYVAFRESRHLTGAEEPVVDATAVCLVDTRARYFTVQFPLPSASPADDFTVRVIFQARVTDPERAAAEGPVDVRRFLEGYLAQDAKLTKLGSDYTVESIAAVRDMAVSRIEAYCEFNPISLPGLTIELDSAGVLTPHELRIHQQELRDERRRQELAELQAEGEDRSIQRHKTLVAEGPAALTALGLARGETPVNAAIENAREDERLSQERFAEAFRILQQTGALDYIDFDPTAMAHAYLEKLTGQPVQSRQRDVLRGGHGKSIGAASTDDDDEAPDEAELDDE
jgi:hypothetical protein